MERKERILTEDQFARIDARTNKILKECSEKWGISNKEYISFCIKFCSAQELDPHNTNQRVAIRKIRTKKSEESMIARFSETRNTIISFIKQMEKGGFDSLNSRVESLEIQLKKEAKDLALQQLKSTIIIADMLSEILTDDKVFQKKFFDKYVKKLMST